MKGLLLKDIYTLMKQLRSLFFVLFFLSFVMNSYMCAFLIYYAAMLPITAFAYDERSKWDELALMMPYSIRDLVGSKYLLGLCSVLAASAFSCILLPVSALIKGGSAYDPSGWIGILFLALIALILMAINLPLTFLFGVEKGRIVLCILLGVGVSLGFLIKEQLLPLVSLFAHPLLPALILLALTVVLLLLSLWVSTRIYQKKHFS